MNGNAAASHQTDWSFYEFKNSFHLTGNNGVASAQNYSYEGHDQQCLLQSDSYIQAHVSFALIIHGLHNTMR